MEPAALQPCTSSTIKRSHFHQQHRRTARIIDLCPALCPAGRIAEILADNLIIAKLAAEAVVDGRSLADDRFQRYELCRLVAQSTTSSAMPTSAAMTATTATPN